MKRDEHDGDVEAADDGCEARRRRVREHVAEDQVQVGGLEARQEGVGGFGFIDHAEVRDLRAPSFDSGDEDLEFGEEFFQEAGELAPIDVVANTEDADAGGAGFTAWDSH